MNFNRRDSKIEEPEINLIPFIDVLLVILIFLMLTTTYSKFNELKIVLPSANAEQLKNQPNEIIISITADGKYAINDKVLQSVSVHAIAEALRLESKNAEDIIVIIRADASSSHQSVITAMEATKDAGLSKLTFATLSE